jgi:DNA-binding IclR family transcriptional regulator
MTGSSEKDGTQSIKRALDVLDVLAGSGDYGAKLSEIVRATHLTPPTAHRILRVLVDRQVVERNPITRRYMVGQQIPNLALARTARSPLSIAAEPHLRHLAETLGDTIYLTIRAGLDALCIARHFGTFHIQVVTIQVGVRRALGFSAAGVAMLAAMSEKQARDVIARNAPRYAAANVSRTHLEEVVEQSRRKGYFFRERGLIAGTRAVSVAIRATDTTPLASITAGAVDRRLRARRAGEVAEVLQASSRMLLAALETTGGAGKERPRERARM